MLLAHICELETTRPSCWTTACVRVEARVAVPSLDTTLARRPPELSSFAPSVHLSVSHRRSYTTP